MMEYLIVCIGNRDGGDDAVGPYIADALQISANDTFGVLDTGTVPENFTSVIKRYHPAHLILVDAVDMYLEPGEIRIVPKEKIGQMHISSHNIPLSVIINYLEEFIDHVMLIGIQPHHMTGSMSTKVKTSAELLITLLRTKDLSSIQKLD
jgi:hydrogenase 3 maturation protease